MPICRIATVSATPLASIKVAGSVAEAVECDPLEAVTVGPVAPHGRERRRLEGLADRVTARIRAEVADQAGNRSGGLARRSRPR
jgi:hypothetical protein